MTENDLKVSNSNIFLIVFFIRWKFILYYTPCTFSMSFCLVCEMLKSKSICCGNRNADFPFEYAIKVNVDYIEHYVVFYSLKKGKVVATLLCSSKIAEPMKFSPRWWFKYWICGGIVL